MWSNIWFIGKPFSKLKIQIIIDSEKYCEGKMKSSCKTVK
jgi:hypothetical protein